MPQTQPPLRAVIEFAAVELFTPRSGSIGRFNIERLRRAIELNSRPTWAEAISVLRSEYPAMSETDIHRYIHAAGRCVEYDVRVGDR